MEQWVIPILALTLLFTLAIPVMGEDRDAEAQDLPFVDVCEADYYYDAIAWAYRNGIVTGEGETVFGPSDPMTRGEAISYLWRFWKDKLGRSGRETNPFTDIQETDDCYEPILWAVSWGLTNGTSPTTFSPNAPCMRAHFLTFLYRLYAGVAAGEQWYEDTESWASEMGMRSRPFPMDLSETCPRCDLIAYLYMLSGENPVVFMPSMVEDDGTVDPVLSEIQISNIHFEEREGKLYLVWDTEGEIGSGSYQVLTYESRPHNFVPDTPYSVSGLYENYLELNDATRTFDRVCVRVYSPSSYGPTIRFGTPYYADLTLDIHSGDAYTYTPRFRFAYDTENYYTIQALDLPLNRSNLMQIRIGNIDQYVHFYTGPGGGGSSYVSRGETPYTEGEYRPGVIEEIVIDGSSASYTVQYGAWTPFTISET